MVSGPAGMKREVQPHTHCLQQVEGFSFLNWTVNEETVESQELCISVSELKVEVIYGQLENAI